MKAGISIEEMAREISRQAESKRDFVADSRKLLMAPDTGNLEINLTQGGADVARGVEEFTIKPHAHKQLATFTGIPQRYYDRMPTALKAVNVNHWLNNEPGQRMVRTLDQEVRAFMSDSYRPLDNYDLAQSVLPILMEQPEMRIESCQLTDTKMYIKAIFPQIEADLDPKVGDYVKAGLVISNSEVGAGSLTFETMAFRLWCLNGCTTAVGHKRRHIGKRQGETDTAEEFYRDATKAKDDEAFWMKIQDTARATVSQESFDKIAQRMIATKAHELGNPIEVCEIAARRFNLNEEEQGGILQHLVRGGDLTGFGLLNAVTRYSQDVSDYDRATELERLGGDIIELPRNAWQEFAPVEVAA